MNRILMKNNLMLILQSSQKLKKKILSGLHLLRKAYAENIFWIFSLTFDYYEHKVIFHQYSIHEVMTNKITYIE